MSGLLHPVGPESALTYWARRGLLLAAATVFVVALILIIIGAGAPSPASADSAAPAQASASATETAAPTPSFVNVSASATPKPLATKTPKLKASTRKTLQGAAASCAAHELQPTLTGKRRIALKQSTTFQLSLINGSDRTCIAQVTRKSFELKINYGRDRIWSTADCPSMIKTINRKLRAEYAVAWSLTWDGKRSKSTCKSTSRPLRPGRYVITAHLDGAAPVKLQMILK